MEVQLGDKLWAYVGPSGFVVGYVLEQSPDGSMLGVSGIPYDDYKKLNVAQRASIGMTWCKIESLSYIGHTPLAEIQALNQELEANKSAGSALFNVAKQ